MYQSRNQAKFNQRLNKRLFYSSLSSNDFSQDRGRDPTVTATDDSTPESANVEWEKAKANLLASKTPEEFLENYIKYRATHKVVELTSRRRPPDLAIAKKDPIYKLWVATAEARKAINDALIKKSEEEFRKLKLSKMKFYQRIIYKFNEWATANPWFGQLIMAVTAVIIFGPLAAKGLSWLSAHGISATGLLSFFEESKKNGDIAPPPPPPETEFPWALIAGAGALILAVTMS